MNPPKTRERFSLSSNAAERRGEESFCISDCCGRHRGGNLPR
jgi:hypothetical protein